jgi:hypothetical protein
MKAIIYIFVAVMITGCASNQASLSRWNDMWVDIALRHKYERYSCAHALEGYSKDPPTFSHRKRAIVAKEQAPARTPGINPEAEKQSAQRTEDSIRTLSEKINVLEDALKTNVATTNQNQDLLVQQINALKAQLVQLRQPRVSEK